MDTVEVTWVGDRPKNWGDDMRGYTIAIKDPDGIEQRNVKLDRKRDEDAPKVGEELEGTLTDHPRFADAMVFNEGVSGPPKNSAPQGRTQKDEDITRSVAFKGAIELAASGKIGTDEVDLYTEAFVKTLEGVNQDDGIPF